MGESLELWNESSLKLVNKRNVRRSAYNVMSFSPSGELIENWPGVSGLLSIPQLQTVEACYDRVRFDRDGTYYARIRNDEELQRSIICEVNGLRPVCMLEDMIVAAFLDGKAIAYCDKVEVDDQMEYAGIAIVDIPSGEILHKFNMDGGSIKSIAVSKQSIAVLSENGNISLWDGAGYGCLGQTRSALYDPIERPYVLISFSDDGKYLFEHVGGKIIIREPETLKEVATLEGFFVQCTSGYLVVSSKMDQMGQCIAQIYNTDTLELIYAHDLYKCSSLDAISGANIAHICSDERKILLREGKNTIGVYGLRDGKNPITPLGKIISRYGMEYQGVDFTGAYPDKAFTEDEKTTLRQYGAIVDA
jgi:WD40 repeat protein